jgi:TPR repeat protein
LDWIEAVVHGLKLRAICAIALAATLTACSADFRATLERAGRDLNAALGADPAGDNDTADALYREALEARAQGDAPRAFAAFLDAAERGHAAAAYEVSRIYAEGKGRPQDLDAAADWTDRAARLGDARAQFLIGSAYYGGIGVAQDYAVAAAYLNDAAEQDHAQAQYLLGEAYSNGRGVAQDAAWAARWYGKAAAQGMAQAQYAYGVAHAAGLGLPENLSSGYAWLRLAARGGQTEAATLADRLAPRLDDAERATAEKMIAAFRPHREHAFEGAASLTFVQHALNRRGFDAGPVDGINGARTRAAIRRYQSAEGLSVDGQVTRDLLERLRAR